MKIVLFTKCITKIDETTIDDAEGLDLDMLMYKLIQYSSYYCKTTECLWFSLNMKQLILMLILLIIREWPGGLRHYN